MPTAYPPVHTKPTGQVKPGAEVLLGRFRVRPQAVPEGEASPPEVGPRLHYAQLETGPVKESPAGESLLKFGEVAVAHGDRRANARVGIRKRLNARQDIDDGLRAKAKHGSAAYMLVVDDAAATALAIRAFSSSNIVAIWGRIRPSCPGVPEEAWLDPTCWP